MLMVNEGGNVYMQVEGENNIREKLRLGFCPVDSSVDQQIPEPDQQIPEPDQQTPEPDSEKEPEKKKDKKDGKTA